jgi:hypothetical protein
MSSNLTDRPAFADEDSLNMKAYADALKEFIADAEAPLTIALQGEWGSGKTSLMTALEKRLVKDPGSPYLGVWVNTWQYALLADPEEAIVKILLGIIGQISAFANPSGEERATLFRKMLRFGGGIASDVFKKYSGIDLEKNAKALADADGAPTQSGVEELKSELAGLVAKALGHNRGKKGFLFFIDDLDRIDPPVAVQILELLKNIFDLEKCIFVLAIDYGVVVKGLKPKFGEMNAGNEREFRSFFDKIIQLPFSMPVGAYHIDGFLVGSLAKIGYLDKTERENEALCKNLTDYALETVGTNPRSLKRLINSLSLIRLLIAKTATRKDDEDFTTWKDVMFALVCLQVQFPRVYDALRAEPDFPRWDEAFAGRLRLPALATDEAERLKGLGNDFDEAWEQVLWRLCRGDAFLEAHALGLSQTLNRVKSRIAAAEGQNAREVVELLLRLSAVTDVKAGASAGESAEDVSLSGLLHTLSGALGLKGVPGAGGWHEVRYENGTYVHSWYARLRKNFDCELWHGRERHDDKAGDYLTWIRFTVEPEGEGAVLKAWGDCCGNQPQERFAGFDLTAADVQAALAKAEEAARGAWWDFDVQGVCDHDATHLWWNVSIPFASRYAFSRADFSRKLRGALAKLADALAPLMAYRRRKE